MMIIGAVPIGQTQRELGVYRLPPSRFCETSLPLKALFAMTEETLKTGGSDKQPHWNAALSVKPPATEQQICSTSLQDVLELTARFDDATSEFD